MGTLLRGEGGITALGGVGIVKASWSQVWISAISLVAPVSTISVKKDVSSISLEATGFSCGHDVSQGLRDLTQQIHIRGTASWWRGELGHLHGRTVLQLFNSFVDTTLLFNGLVRLLSQAIEHVTELSIRDRLPDSQF